MILQSVEEANVGDGGLDGCPRSVNRNLTFEDTPLQGLETRRVLGDLWPTNHIASGFAGHSDFPNAFTLLVFHVNAKFFRPCDADHSLDSDRLWLRQADGLVKAAQVGRG